MTGKKGCSLEGTRVFRVRVPPDFGRSGPPVARSRLGQSWASVTVIRLVNHQIPPLSTPLEHFTGNIFLFRSHGSVFSKV